MSGHTPGPWIIQEDPPRTFSDGEVDAGGYRIDADHIEQLAYVWRDNKRWGDNPTPFGAVEAEANSRLIAAAPELVEALQSLLRESVFLCQQLAARGLPGVKGDTVDNVMEAARAAIAKATGS